MQPISEFPYGDERTDKNPMHKRLLLLETKPRIVREFAIGYYDAVGDVFKVCRSGFQHTESNHYDEMQVTSPTHWYDDYYCIMPRNFLRSNGPRVLMSFMLMHNALARMRDEDMFNSDIDTVIEKSGYATLYLLVTTDRRIFISDVGSFVEPVGKQFSAYSPSEINGGIYHVRGPVPRETIRYAVNLLKFGGGKNG